VLGENSEKKKRKDSQGVGIPEEKLKGAAKKFKEAFRRASRKKGRGNQRWGTLKKKKDTRKSSETIKL